MFKDRQPKSAETEGGDMGMRQTKAAVKRELANRLLAVFALLGSCGMIIYTTIEHSNAQRDYQQTLELINKLRADMDAVKHTIEVDSAVACAVENLGRFNSGLPQLSQEGCREEREEIYQSLTLVESMQQKQTPRSTQNPFSNPGNFVPRR